MNLLESFIFLTLYCCRKWSREIIFPRHRLKRQLCLYKTCGVNKIPDAGMACAALSWGWLCNCLQCSTDTSCSSPRKTSPTESWEQTSVCCTIVPIKQVSQTWLLKKKWVFHTTADKTSGKQKNVGAAISSPQPFLIKSKNVCKASPAPSSWNQSLHVLVKSTSCTLFCK